MHIDKWFFSITGTLLLIVGSYIHYVLSVTTFELFAGLSLVFLGVIFVVYGLFLALRNQPQTAIQNAIQQSRELEQQLTREPTSGSLTPHNPSPMPVNANQTNYHASTVIPTRYPHDEYATERERFVAELKTLVRHHTLGLIDQATFVARKLALMQNPVAHKRATQHEHTAIEEISDDSVFDDLLIDYMEGIITSTEYEYRKSQMTNPTST